MRMILSLFLVLLFVTGCGGGGDGDGSDGGRYDECQDPLLTTTAPLPRGCHPSAFSAIGEVPLEEISGSIQLYSDGTFTGTVYDSEFTELWQYCRVGTQPPNIAGRWVYTYNDEFCMRFDFVPGEVICERSSYSGISCGSSAKIAGTSEGIPNEDSSEVQEELEYLFEDILDSVLSNY